jgi:hypothetical protein
LLHSTGNLDLRSAEISRLDRWPFANASPPAASNLNWPNGIRASVISFPRLASSLPLLPVQSEERKGGDMKNINRIGISIISGSVLAIATWALPARAPRAVSSQNAPKGSVQLQSVSGNITTVARDSFTLTTTGGTPKGLNFAQVDSTSRTMMFVIDQNTTIDGKLQVGANADVIYRQDAGNNMAVSVTVSK